MTATHNIVRLQSDWHASMVLDILN